MLHFKGEACEHIRQIIFFSPVLLFFDTRGEGYAQMRIAAEHLDPDLVELMASHGDLAPVTIALRRLVPVHVLHDRASAHASARDLSVVFIEAAKDRLWQHAEKL